MNQVLHIFRKDLHYLWQYVTVFLLIFVINIDRDIRVWPGPGSEAGPGPSAGSLLSLLIPLSIGMLVAMVIFQEALPGDRQFWLSRPYDWRRLLASKFLFLILFINVPLFVSDCVILAVQGFPVAGVFSSLLLRQCILMLLFVLPSVALATLCSGVAEFFLAWTAVGAVLVVVTVLQSLWIAHRYKLAHSNVAVAFAFGPSPRLAVLAGFVLVGLIVWQYARRHTLAGRIAVIALSFLFLPGLWAYSWIHSRFLPPIHPPSANRSSVKVEIDPARIASLRIGPYQEPARVSTLRIPLTVTGLPEGTLMRGGGQTRIFVDNKPWNPVGSGPRERPMLPASDSVFYGRIERGDAVEPSSMARMPDSGYYMVLEITGDDPSILRSHSPAIHSALELELVNDRPRTKRSIEPLLRTHETFDVPDLGHCRILFDDPSTFLACRAGLGPSVETAVFILDSMGDALRLVDGSMGPRFSVPWLFSPVTKFGPAQLYHVGAGSELVFTPRYKISQFQVTMDDQAVRILSN